MDYLEGLNDRQKEAVLHTEGPLLIMAGAGSGKTRVVTHKIAYLIKEKNVFPGSILAITFTNKAAGEMKDRVGKLLDTNVDSMWMGTFHSICVRILRRDIHKLGYDRSFSIYDRDDQITLIKECIKEINIDKEMFKERSLLSQISSFKDEQIDPDKYINENYGDYYARNVGEIYALYQKKLKQYNALDFDDLIIKAVELLRADAEIRDYYQGRFQYVFVDEYQDTNKIQYSLVKLLSARWHNLCVVGDSDQCVVEGTKVTTPSGEVNIEDLEIGDKVYSASGWGKVLEGTIDHKMKNAYKGPIMVIKTQGNREIRVTPNHILFSKLNPNPGVHYVYLMYKKELGYRIGQTQGVRAGDRGGIVNGLAVRINQENADKAWILKVCNSKEEAGYYETIYSLKYNIPTLVYHLRGRNMCFTQDTVNKVFREIDTRSNVIKLMEDLLIFEEYPHIRSGAVIRKNAFRRVLNLTYFGGRITGLESGWHSHRINLNTSGDELREKASLSFNTRNGSQNTWRIETERKDYNEASKFSAEVITLEDDIEINERARLCKDITFNFTPAAGVKQSMSVAVYEDGQIIEDIVISAEIEEYDGFVYDISVPNFRQYICGGLVVHNSIYAWRGADVSNILDFEKEFKGAKVVLLEQNYRSTQKILTVANKVIKNNYTRHDKNLWTDNVEGDPIRYEQLEYSDEEGRFVADEIRQFVNYKGYKASEIAVLYRTNAQSRSFEESFMRAGLPYKIVGGLKFYDRREVKDIIAYLKAIQNPNDNISIKRIINTPKRGIGLTTIDKIEQYAMDNGDSLYGALLDIDRIDTLNARARNSVKPFVDLMNVFMAKKEIMGIKDFIEELIYASGYIPELEKENTIEATTRIDNIREFLSVALTFEEEYPEAHMEEFLASVSLLSDVDKTVDSDNMITLMTVHSSKGLEYPIVFLGGMEQGLFPIGRAMESDDDLEEERRLCYVAVTRAEQHLIITNAKSRTIYGKTNGAIPSIFIREMGDAIEKKIERPVRTEVRTEVRQDRPEEQLYQVRDFTMPKASKPRPAMVDNRDLNVNLGDKVRHKKWGEGMVVMVKDKAGDKELSISFEGQGIKRLLQSIAPIEII